MYKKQDPSGGALGAIAILRWWVKKLAVPYVNTN